MSDLTITLIQSELVWEDIQANIDHFDTRIDAAGPGSDLIILPEMLSTGFSMGAENLAEAMEGATVTWMREKAASINTVITGSVMIREQNRFFNRLIWARPDGSMETYDKKHLFRYAGEEKVYTPGENRLTVDINGWNVRPFICYDLRFPIWTRNFKNVYDLAIFVANWPKRRSTHWRALLRARAIENQAFVAAVNRVGQDGNGIDYSGDSAVIDPLGKVLFEQTDDACATTVRLSRETLTDYRQQFPAWKDADIDMVPAEH